jgi:hypothetical protein
MPHGKSLHCECGHQVTGSDEAELVDRVRVQARDADGIAFSVKEAMLVVFRSQLDVSLEPHNTDTCIRRASAYEGGER